MTHSWMAMLTNCAYRWTIWHRMMSEYQISAASRRRTHLLVVLVGKSPWLASQWLFRSSGNLVSSTAASATWFHARRDKHSSTGPACLADTRYAYLSGGSSRQSGRLRCPRAHPPPSIRNPVNNTMPLKYLWRGCLFTGPLLRASVSKRPRYRVL